MRIIYIPGFGETATIFEKIAPHIEAEQRVFIDNWTLLGNKPRKELNVLQYAKELVANYQITQADVIIGHSMGGWIAFHIKHLTNCRIVQIASWTQPNRVVLPIKNPKMIYFLVKSGIYLNRFTRQYAVNRGYKGKSSMPIFVETFNRLIKGNKNNIINQLRLILNPIHENISISPDLRIHAKADKVIRYPQTTFHEVSGDHFTLYTQPQEVYRLVNQWLSEESLTN